MMNEEFLEIIDNSEEEQKEVKKVISTGKSLQLRRIYGIDLHSSLDWPEHPLDAVPPVVVPNSKLRRVLSSSARVGFNRTEAALLDGGAMKRSYQSSGNLGLLWKEQQDKNEVIDHLSDVSDMLSDEDCDTFNELPQDDNETRMMKSCPRYVRIVSKQMVGISVSVWVQRRLRRHINNLKVSPVGVGLMGYMGNKVIKIPH